LERLMFDKLMFTFERLRLEWLIEWCKEGWGWEGGVRIPAGNEGEPRGAYPFKTAALFALLLVTTRTPTPGPSPSPTLALLGAATAVLVLVLGGAAVDASTVGRTCASCVSPLPLLELPPPPLPPPMYDTLCEYP
jgi:hypothetical protein